MARHEFEIPALFAFFDGDRNRLSEPEAWHLAGQHFASVAAELREQRGAGR